MIISKCLTYIAVGGQSMLTSSSIPSSQASPELLPEACYGSSGTAGWPHRGSKMCILATEQAGTPSRSGRSGKGGEGREYGLITLLEHIPGQAPKKEQADHTQR